LPLLLLLVGQWVGVAEWAAGEATMSGGEPVTTLLRTALVAYCAKEST